MMQVQIPSWLPLVGRVLFCVLLSRDGHEPPDPFPGVLVLFNWHRSLGGVLLFVIIFPAPFFVHHFWNETDSYTRLSEFAHLIKELSLAGAALLLIS